MEWCESSFLVGMPHMVPDQLSEVELLKVLGDLQWQNISRILQAPSPQIVNDHGERLYASFINIETCFGRKTPMELGEGMEVHVCHASRFHARRFVEGFFCFDNAAIPRSLGEGIRGRADLEALDIPWAYLTNAFVTRQGSNLRLRTFAPVGREYGKEVTTEVAPAGIRDHELVERTGNLGLPGMEGAVPLARRGGDDIVYDIVPESDLNGAGLLYFARYVAIANYGERLFLRRGAEVEVSARLIRLLATKRRRLFYFANADEGDAVKLRVAAFVARAEGGAAGAATRAAPLQFYFVTELRRQSDGTLMAKSVAHKELVIAKRLKSLLLEAGRIGQQCGLGAL
jgi:probable biosynthetic protein (TIGR04098 family)